MSKRNCYYDTSTGEADDYIRQLLKHSQHNKAGEITLKIINNELTARQKEIFMLYYFKELTLAEIARSQGISHQAVSAVISRARKRIFRYMKYYFQ
ncbi:MAG: sigma-70 family RNA polymerase sigma factor [Ruminococcus sp.]|nr:sigma-70 family RNA polymerase sigma factor [Ruminococcus sp.]